MLRAAGGQVRCGRCGEVFNALARLAEDASAFSRPANRRPDRPASRRSRWKRAPTRSCIRRHRSAPAEPELRPTARTSRRAMSNSHACSSSISSSRRGTRLPRRHVISPHRSPRHRPFPDRPRPRRRQPRRRAQRRARKRAPREVAPAPAAAPAPAPPPAPVAAADAPGTGAAAESADDGSLEFTLPPGDLDRVFVDPTAVRPSSLAARGSHRAAARRASRRRSTSPTTCGATCCPDCDNGDSRSRASRHNPRYNSHGAARPPCWRSYSSHR